jgi:hypothetical protein
MGNKNYSKGISWIDDCRIPTTDNLNGGGYNTKGTSKKNLDDATSYAIKIIESDFIQPIGRFPANLLVSDDMLNDGVISKSVKGRNDIGSSTYGGNSLLNSKTKMNNTDRGFNDKGSNSRYYNIDKWFDKILND